MQRHAQKMLRQVVGQPFIHFAQEFGLVGADLFLEFAKRGLARRFAAIDSALRHLPAFDGLVDAAADKDKPFAD